MLVLPDDECWIQRFVAEKIIITSVVYSHAEMLRCSQSHIKSHHLFGNKRESLYSRLEKQPDPTIQVVAQNDRIGTVHKVDDSTNIIWQLRKHQKKEKKIRSLYKQTFNLLAN